MRAVNLLGLVLFGIAVVILAPAVTGQPGGFGGKGKKGGGFGGPGGGFGGMGGGMAGMSQDPNAYFDYLAKNRQFFLITETRALGGPLTQFAQERRITNGQITRQQFIEFYDWRAKQQAASPAPGNPFGGGGFGGGGPGGFGGGGKKGGFDKGGPGSLASLDPEAINQKADEEFRKRDQNGDAKLTPDEVRGPMQRDFALWDKDGNGYIDLSEFRAYFASRVQAMEDQRGGGAAIIVQEEDLDAKPVVYRANGKMPAGLPPWFLELDTDKDGQVALYEWRRANKAYDDFTTWDLNGDGFITPEEALRQQTVIAKSMRGSPGSMAFGAGGDEENPFAKFGKGKGKGGFDKGAFGMGGDGSGFGKGKGGGGDQGGMGGRFQFGGGGADNGGGSPTGGKKGKKNKGGGN
jgi:hypothetical protein